MVHLGRDPKPLLLQGNMLKLWLRERTASVMKLNQARADWAEGGEAHQTLSDADGAEDETLEPGGSHLEGCPVQDGRLLGGALAR